MLNLMLFNALSCIIFGVDVSGECNRVKNELKGENICSTIVHLVLRLKRILPCSIRLQLLSLDRSLCAK